MPLLAVTKGGGRLEAGEAWAGRAAAGVSRLGAKAGCRTEEHPALASPLPASGRGPALCSALPSWALCKCETTWPAKQTLAQGAGILPRMASLIRLPLQPSAFLSASAPARPLSFADTPSPPIWKRGPCLFAATLPTLLQASRSTAGPILETCLLQPPSRCVSFNT